MPVNPSAAAVELLLTRWRDDVLIYLLTVTHPALPTIRLARNNQNIISRGETFTAAPFDLKLGNDNDEFPSLSITLPNVDREIGRSLLAIQSGMEVAIEAVFASDPDDVWKRYARLELHDVTFGALVLQGTISHRRINHEPFPNRRIIPNKFFAYYR
jgi:hypothetical protein